MEIYKDFMKLSIESRTIIAWFITFWAAMVIMKATSVEVGVAALIAELACLSWRLK